MAGSQPAHAAGPRLRVSELEVRLVVVAAARNCGARLARRPRRARGSGAVAAGHDTHYPLNLFARLARRHPARDPRPRGARVALRRARRLVAVARGRVERRAVGRAVAAPRGVERRPEVDGSARAVRQRRIPLRHQAPRALPRLRHARARQPLLRVVRPPNGVESPRARAPARAAHGGGGSRRRRRGAAADGAAEGGGARGCGGGAWRPQRGVELNASQVVEPAAEAPRDDVEADRRSAAVVAAADGFVDTQRDERLAGSRRRRRSSQRA